MTKQALLDLASATEKAGIADAKHAASNPLYARWAFHRLGVAAILRAIAADRED